MGRKEKKLDRSLFSVSKIAEFVVLGYKHLLLSHSVNLSHLHPMPKKKKIEFQNLDGNHGHKLIQFPHLQMRKMRLKEGCDLPGISVTEPRWGGQWAEPLSPPVLLRPLPTQHCCCPPSLEAFLHLASPTLSSAESLLPNTLTTASGLPYQPQSLGLVSERGRSSFW